MTEQEQEYLSRIHELEQQVSRLQTELKKNSETQYGLRWMDVPEAFDEKAENAVPILEEVKEKAITSEDGKPTHILIEGDNYHALTCLNYTHKGAIDIIYIDPPYNTGSDGFIYKDKRVLDKFPDGTTVPTDHPLRHSYWLSFMHKRLQLAKNLLSKRGVIFISIDDNEQANLKLLCDQVFGEKNLVTQFIWHNNKKGRQMDRHIKTTNEFVLMYANNINAMISVEKIIDVDTKVYPYKDDVSSYKKGYPLHNGTAGFHIDNRPNLCYTIYYNELTHDIVTIDEKNGYKGDWSIPISEKGTELMNRGYTRILPKRNTKYNTQRVWRWGQDKVNRESSELFFVNENGGLYPYQKERVEEDGTKSVKHTNYIDIDTSRGRNVMNELFCNQVVFDFPKPVELISSLLKTTESSTILDFFAGSGTTMHATMQLNEEDGGHRQCILVTNNENQICEKVTYERNRRVMQGYTNAKSETVAGLGNSMKYYRTAFVGEHKITDITDADKVALTQKAGCLLALGENTLEEISTATTYQIFQLRQGDRPANGFEYTAIYFSGNLIHFADFRHEIEDIQQTNSLARIAVYVFTWGDPSIFENEFDDLTGITIKPIPQPILEIYQNIHKL